MYASQQERPATTPAEGRDRNLRLASLPEEWASSIPTIRNMIKDMVKEITGVPVDVVVTDEHYIDESSDPDGTYSYAYVRVKPDADHDNMIAQLQNVILHGTNIKAECHDNLAPRSPTPSASEWKHPGHNRQVYNTTRTLCVRDKH